MLTTDQATARAAALIDAALKAGADAADVLYVGDASTGVQVRLGALEDVQRSEGEEIGLRFFVGRRSASTSSSDLSDDALAAMVERASAMAREAPEDVHAGLAPAELLLREAGPDVAGDDRQDPAPAELKQLALAIEDAARSVEGVTNSEGAGISAGRSVVALATSHGFCRGYATSGYSGSASVIAGTGGAMQRDYASHSVRWFEDLDDADAIGRLAGERAVARVGPGKLSSGSMPVIFDPRVGGSLISHLLGAITGSAIARKTSFLLGREDEPIFAPYITITDDPHRPRGLRSKPFDGEGLPTRPRKLVADGRLTGWLLDSASARQLGLQPTGHATRGIGGAPGASATNVHLEPGRLSQSELIGDIKRGVYVTELIGQGVNPVTGDYSRGASGFIIEDGEIAGPVAEITIAGNLLDIFRTLTPASDLEFRRAINVPTLRIEGMTVAGA
ncbi:TldD/PmbA family protein [Sphingosinicella rhizophila]|uniref:TldD/PmbA family protein n=1 Tax=Sphingosinicella rhizophila TaxID=3050082 RepID=A0ABU3Q6P3_9SPHN|nr:TldD/PmbA family protein [Sphingosinicella sp. GR2756]MDT9599077.1 TldD/PmbA family protein [Sphingosinicella sp. GR2756]